MNQKSSPLNQPNSVSLLLTPDMLDPIQRREPVTCYSNNTLIFHSICVGLSLPFIDIYLKFYP